MKKIARILVAIVAVLSLGLAPGVVHAQVEEVVPTTELPSTGGSEVKAPDTGLAPTNRVAQNAAVFVGGSMLGAGLGLGIVTLRKKRFNQ